MYKPENPANNNLHLFSGKSVVIYVSIVMLWRKMRLWYSKELDSERTTILFGMYSACVPNLNRKFNILYRVDS